MSSAFWSRHQSLHDIIIFLTYPSLLANVVKNYYFRSSKPKGATKLTRNLAVEKAQNFEYKGHNFWIIFHAIYYEFL